MHRIKRLFKLVGWCLLHSSITSCANLHYDSKALGNINFGIDSLTFNYERDLLYANYTTHDSLYRIGDFYFKNISGTFCGGVLCRLTLNGRDIPAKENKLKLPDFYKDFEGQHVDIFDKIAEMSLDYEHQAEIDSITNDRWYYREIEYLYTVLSGEYGDNLLTHNNYYLHQTDSTNTTGLWRNSDKNIELYILKRESTITICLEFTANSFQPDSVVIEYDKRKSKEKQLQELL
jgi:hypothetical protein